MKRKPKMQSPGGNGAFRMTENRGLQFSLNFTSAKERAGWTEIPATKKDATAPESKVKRQGEPFPGRTRFVLPRAGDPAKVANYKELLSGLAHFAHCRL